eukprot:12793256-Alexandrium_andersonii.AAC.1
MPWTSPLRRPRRRYRLLRPRSLGVGLLWLPRPDWGQQTMGTTPPLRPRRSERGGCASFKRAPKRRSWVGPSH